MNQFISILQNSDHWMTAAILIFWGLMGKKIWYICKNMLEDYKNNVQETLKKAEHIKDKSEHFLQHVRQKNLILEEKIFHIEQDQMQEQDRLKKIYDARIHTWHSSQSNMMTLRKRAMLNEAFTSLKDVLVHTTMQKVEHWMKNDHRLSWAEILKSALHKEKKLS